MKILASPRLLCTLVAVVVAVPFVRQSRAVTLTDRFTQFNPTLWSASYEGSGPLFRIQAGRLVAAVPARSTGETFMAKATSLFAVSGDFDARVGYRLLNWPSGNGAKLSLGADDVGSVQRVSDSGLGGEVYLTHFATDGVNGSRPTRAAFGRLRLVRKGNRLAGYALRSGRWMLIHQADVDSTAPVHIHLAVWSHGATFNGRPIRVAFDNFTLRYLNGTPPSGKR